MPRTDQHVALKEIAERQHGVVSRAQAAAAGFSGDSIGRLVRLGAWSRVFPRVYSLWTPAASEMMLRQRLLAAALWVGGASAASHRAAAWSWQMDGVETPPVEVSATKIPRSRPGVVIHRAGDLRAEDVVVRDGIPVTSAVRTLADLGAVAPPSVVELALESALRRKLTTERELDQWLRCRGRRAGSVALRSLLETPSRAATESVLEALVWRLLRESDLPPPVLQYEVRASERLVARVDFAYPAERLAIEADGYRFHSRPADWKRDLARQNALARMRWLVYRVTWDDVTRRPRALGRHVSHLLSSRRAGGSRSFG